MISTRKFRKFVVTPHPISTSKLFAMKKALVLTKRANEVNYHRILLGLPVLDESDDISFETVPSIEDNVDPESTEVPVEKDETDVVPLSFNSELSKENAIKTLSDSIDQFQEEKTRLFLLLKKVLADQQKRRIAELAAEKALAEKISTEKETVLVPDLGNNEDISKVETADRSSQLISHNINPIKNRDIESRPFFNSFRNEGGQLLNKNLSYSQLNNSSNYMNDRFGSEFRERDRDRDFRTINSRGRGQFSRGVNRGISRGINHRGFNKFR